MNSVDTILTSLKICGNLGNINIISKYIDDSDLLDILSDNYWTNETNITMVIDRYILRPNDLIDDTMNDMILQYETTLNKLTYAIHDILYYYFTEYDLENIQDILDFNEQKKTLDIWLRLSIINYNNLLEYLSTNFTLRVHTTHTHNAFL